MTEAWQASPAIAPPLAATGTIFNGEPSARYRRILVLKPDHIGDLLVAAPALMLLRRSFHDAHITLLCAPWNVGLAQRLDICDEVHTTQLFSQSSLDDVDPEALYARRGRAVAALKELQLGPFDLAIDMRRDEDTRELLKLFDARTYAGFGDLETYGYLDVALPVTHLGVHEGASSLRLLPADLARGHRVTADGLHLTVSQGEVELSILTDSVWAPSEDGEPDTRELGASLWQIYVRQPIAVQGGVKAAELSFPAELSRDQMDFGPGWLAWEPWGRWSSLDQVNLKVRFPAAVSGVELLIRVQGHTSPSHPNANIRVATSDAYVSHLFRSGDEPATLRLRCHAKLGSPETRSEPILLRAGRYAGIVRLSVPTLADWEPLTLTVRSARMGHAIATLILPNDVPQAGILDFAFDVELKDPADPIVVEIRCAGALQERRLGILSIDLQCMQAKSPLLPIAHMEAQLLDLASMAAIRFAPHLMGPGGEVAERLREPRKGSTATAAVKRLRERRGETRGFWQRPAKRLLLGIGIGANKETKLWPTHYFVELGQRLLARPEVDLVLIGGPAEAQAIAELIELLGGGPCIIDLCACCLIEDLGEVLAELDGFIGLDTGTTHFAGRIGLKTLAIFGAAHDPLVWGPVGGRSGWAAMDVPCRSCSKTQRSECAFDLQCMTLLTPDAVWPTVERTFF